MKSGAVSGGPGTNYNEFVMRKSQEVEDIADEVSDCVRNTGELREFIVLREIDSGGRLVVVRFDRFVFRFGRFVVFRLGKFVVFMFGKFVVLIIPKYCSVIDVG
jgi:hypothetical protein